MIRFYLDLDAALENIKIGWQKLHSLQASYFVKVINSAFGLRCYFK